jgi:hypothetical protein
LEKVRDEHLFYSVIYAVWEVRLPNKIVEAMLEITRFDVFLPPHGIRTEILRAAAQFFHPPAFVCEPAPFR